MKVHKLPEIEGLFLSEDYYGVIVEWSETDVGILLDGDDMILVEGLLG